MTAKAPRARTAQPTTRRTTAGLALILCLNLLLQRPCWTQAFSPTTTTTRLSSSSFSFSRVSSTTVHNNGGQHRIARFRPGSVSSLLSLQATRQDQALNAAASTCAPPLEETETKTKTANANAAVSLSTKKPDKPTTTTPSSLITNDNDNHLDDDNNNDASIWLWRSVIVILCALWASNFAAAKLVMAEPNVDSTLYAVARFTTAALALLPGSIGAVKKGLISWETAKGAAICGSWVAFGYLGQTLGLLTTTASRSCVICTLHCVFVAAVTETMRVAAANQQQQNENKDIDDGNTNFNIMRLLPAAVAVLGVAIVELQGNAGPPTVGDALSFAQPIGFGFGYLQLEQLMKKSPQAGLVISAIKLVMVAFFSLVLFEFFPVVAPLASGGTGAAAADWASLTLRVPDFTPILSSPLALGGILYTGLITTALALWVESIAFKRVPATDASIILTTEPLFAAAAGAITLGETFGMSDYVGATLIIGACALAVLMDDEEEDEVAAAVE